MSPLCWDCAYQKRSETRRFPYEYVKKTFEENGCKLILTEYEGFHVPMDYICVCGRPSKITFSRFVFGRRCKQCFLDRNRGENNPSYNPNKTDEERTQGRILDGYKEWKKKCKERDNFTCQCCKKRGGTLHSHHIYSYAEYPDLRTDLENGITLCVNCHKGEGGFHNIYGNKETTPEQLVEFLESRKAFDTATKVIKFIEKNG